MSSRKQTIGAALSVVIAIVLLILIWLPDKKNQLGENTVAITESETTTSDQFRQCFFIISNWRLCKYEPV